MGRGIVVARAANDGAFAASVCVRISTFASACVFSTAGLGFAAAAIPPTPFSVPFAATSCNILLVAGATGAAFVVFVVVFVSAFFGTGFAADVFAAAFVAVTLGTFSAVTFGAFTAFVLAALVPVFLTSSTASSTTFFGRPRFLTGSVVAVVDIISYAQLRFPGSFRPRRLCTRYSIIRM